MDGFDAGSIAVTLRANIAPLQEALSQAKSNVQNFGQGFQQATQGIQTNGKAISDTFDDIGSIRTEARFASITGRLLAMGVASEALGKAASGSLKDFSTAASAGAQGLGRFITIFGFMPTVTGAVLGGITGIVAAYEVYSRAVGKITEAQQKLNEKLATTRAAFVAASAKEDVKDALLGGAQGDVQKKLDQQKDSLEKASLWAHQYAEAVAQAAVAVPQLDSKIASLNEQLKLEQSAARAAGAAGGVPSGAAGAITGLEDQLKDLARQKIVFQDTIENLRRSLQGLGIDAQKPDAAIKSLADHVRNLQEAFKLAGAEREIGGVLTKLDAVGINGQKEITLGIVTPLQEAQKELGATKSAMQKLLEVQLDLNRAANMVSGDDELQGALRARAEQINETLGTLQGKAIGLENGVLSKEAAGRYAAGLSSAIGTGISDGILSGQKPMEALAGIGQNLFKNMLDQTVKNFQDMMVKAFQSIGGAGGEILGGLLTAGLGAAGALLGRKKGSDSFGSIQNGITSTAAVRGIVAGPSSVAIATMGDSLTTAMAPLLTLVGISNNLLQQIANNTRGGGRGGPGSSNVVQTA